MMTNALIKAALEANAAARDTESQEVAFDRLADAIVNTIKTATITYTAGLVAPSGGGPVTGTLTTATLT